VCAGRAVEALSPARAPRVPTKPSRAVQLPWVLLKAGGSDAACKAERIAVKHIALSIFKHC